jgi:2'-5' RNA ligase
MAFPDGSAGTGSGGDATVARLFVAAWPPEHVRNALAALARPVESGVRYTTPEQWHVTLRFLGNAPVEAAVEAFGTVDAETCRAIAGPRVSRVGRDAVVVPVRGLDELAAEVCRATAGVGEPPDPRPFTGHLTVARLRTRAACGIAGAAFGIDWPVREVALVRSETHPDGARYTTVARRALRPPGTA